MENFVGDENIICDQTPGYKSQLGLRNYFWEAFLETLAHEFRDDFVTDVTQTYWPKFCHFCWTFRHGDEENISLV